MGTDVLVCVWCWCCRYTDPADAMRMLLQPVFGAGRPPPLHMWGLRGSHWTLLEQQAVRPELLLAAFTNLLYSAACADMVSVMQQHFSLAELGLQQLQLPPISKLLPLLPVARRVLQGVQLSAEVAGCMGPLDTDPSLQPMPLSGALQYMRGTAGMYDSTVLGTISSKDNSSAANHSSNSSGSALKDVQAFAAQHTNRERDARCSSSVSWLESAAGELPADGTAAHILACADGLLFCMPLHHTGGGSSNNSSAAGGVSGGSRSGRDSSRSSAGGTGLTTQGMQLGQGGMAAGAGGHGGDPPPNRNMCEQCKVRLAMPGLDACEACAGGFDFGSQRAEQVLLRGGMFGSQDGGADSLPQQPEQPHGSDGAAAAAGGAFGAALAPGVTAMLAPPGGGSTGSSTAACRGCRQVMLAATLSPQGVCRNCIAGPSRVVAAMEHPPLIGMAHMPLSTSMRSVVAGSAGAAAAAAAAGPAVSMPRRHSRSSAPRPYANVTDKRGVGDNIRLTVEMHMPGSNRKVRLTCCRQRCRRDHATALRNPSSSATAMAPMAGQLPVLPLQSYTAPLCASCVALYLFDCCACVDGESLIVSCC